MTTSPSRPRRPVGRPPRVSLGQILDAIEEIGLASFSIAELAGRLDVREATLYNYVAGRDQAYRAASARILDRLDTSAPDAAGWPAYVDTVSQRAVELVRASPGVEPYIQDGPYLPETVRFFDTIIAEVVARLPGASADTAYALAAPPFLLSVSMAHDDHVAPLTRWIRRSMIDGMDASLRRGDLIPQIGWRRLLPLADDDR